MATNTIEGRVLQRLLEKLQEIRDALDDDAVFNVVGEVLPAAHVERVLRDYYAGQLGDADLEERLLRNVDEGQFRAICQNALEGLATKKLNLEMLIERRAQAQERRVVPETIARFLGEAADYGRSTLKPVPSCATPSTRAGRRPPLRRYEQRPGLAAPALADRYPRCSTDRETAERAQPGVGDARPSAVRGVAPPHRTPGPSEVFAKGARFYSLQHEEPGAHRLLPRAGRGRTGQVIHERLFAVEVTGGRDPRLREPGVLGDFTPAEPAGRRCPLRPHRTRGDHLAPRARLRPFLDETGRSGWLRWSGSPPTSSCR